MKRLLLLVAALFMVAGVAHAQEYCFVIDPAGAGVDDEVYVTMYVDGEQADLAHLNVWDDDTASEPFDETGEPPNENDPDELGLYYTIGAGAEGSGWHIEGPDEYGDFYWETEDSFMDFVAAGGGGDNEDCMAAPAPEVSASITGPHNVDPGDSVVLEVVTEGLDEGSETYLWDDDSTAATRDLGVVGGGDTGLYTCEVSGEVDEEPLEEPLEASFTLWVGVATPLAGGLGVALLAGACALAGAVSIRRKK